MQPLFAIATHPLFVLGVGIALLVVGERTKDKVAGGILRVIGVLVIILSLVYWGFSFMLISGHLKLYNL